MRLLAVETSTLTGAVALLDGPRVVGESRLNVAVTHGERLLAAVDGILREARWRLEDVDALAVAVGPGSFTGLRIGVSTMKGLAFATGKPLVGIPTLDALAWTLPFAAYPVCPILDAKKGEVYTALYRTLEGRLCRLSPYRVVDPRTLADELRRDPGGPVVFLGDAVAPFAEVLVGALGTAARLGPAACRLPSAASLGDLAVQALDRGERADPAALVPLYVRRSEAELAREARGHAGHAR
jgi:tRNA threonylcarbamoyladenosine biosynthesis protein TsaB